MNEAEPSLIQRTDRGTTHVPPTGSAIRSPWRLRCLVYCLILLVGYCAVSSWQQWRQNDRQAWMLAANNAGMRAEEFDAFHGLYVLLPRAVRQLLSTRRIGVFLSNDGQLEALKRLPPSHGQLDQIILYFPATPEQVKWLRSEFPGVRLLEEGGKGWLKEVVR
jgi:hypothetical protein